MNEVIFFIHLTVIVGTLLYATRLGKEALIAFITLQSLLSNLFLAKQITLFGFETIGTDVFAISGLLGMNLLQEFYGNQITRKTILINSFLLCTYLAMSFFQLWYIPSAFDQHHKAYAIILKGMPRIIIASFLVYVIVQFFDAYFYQACKRLFNSKFLVLRNIISLTCSQTIDTILFSFLGLYGTVESIRDIIIIALIIKCIVICIMTPFTTLARRICRNVHES